MNRPNLTPLVASDFTGWLMQPSSSELTLTPVGPAVPPSATLVNQLFFEKIMPNIGHVVDVNSDSGDRSEKELESLSDILRTVGPVQPLDEDKIALAFAAQQRGTSLNGLSFDIARFHDCQPRSLAR